MILELTFNCPLPNGIHARPASALEEVARDFNAEIFLLNQRTGRNANVKSVLAIVGADVRRDDCCRLSVSGTDARDAFAALSAFLRDEFPRCDDALPALNSPAGVTGLPDALRDSKARVCHGTAVVRGIGHGTIIQAVRLHVPDSIPKTGATDFAAEVRKLDVALSALANDYEERLSQLGSRVEMDLLKAHRSVARDPEFRAFLHESLHRDRATAAGAIAETEAHFTKMLVASESVLLRERALDLQDVCSQLLRQIYGKAASSTDLQLVKHSIVVAESLTPGQFLRLDRSLLKGLVLAHAGTTSHTVILARSFGIPTLTGVTDLLSGCPHGIEAILDAEAGVLVTNVTEPVRRYYETETQRLLSRRTRQRRFATEPAATQDGHKLEIAANISTAAEGIAAFEGGAESIGLFRTEMMFVDRDAAPSEDEQFEEYRSILSIAGNRRAIIRTLDIGGDKPLPYLELSAKGNACPSFRGVRIYRDLQEIFRTQIRALLRASAYGRLKLMLPMVTSLAEVRWVKRVIREEQARCEEIGLRFDKSMPIGAMIEVPAAAFLLDQLCVELDFFSIGTNDLLQCFAAADRTDPRLAAIYDPLQPSFLRLLKKIVTEIRSAGRWIGLCGEMGAQLNCLPLLVGLGLDEISAAPSAVPALKAELSKWRLPVCRRLARRALMCPTADEVRSLIEDCSAQNPPPLIEPDSIIIDSVSTTKAEAIKEAVDQLYVLGRTEHPRAVEEAIWQREATYTTGVGHGFAIPHCKSSMLGANSVILLKLRNPVSWGGSDDEPVHFILLLAIRDADRDVNHMKILSRLARQIMHDDFRECLKAEQDPNALCAFLNKQLRV